MNKFWMVFKTKDIRSKIFWVLLLLLLTRVLANIPIPGVDVVSLKGVLESTEFLKLLDVFAGGGLSNFSIAMLGVGPYITASIIMQLLTIIVPRLTEMQKEEGEAGRVKINQYTRWLTIPLTVIQAFGTIRILQATGGAAVLAGFTPFQWFITLLSITAGSMLVMWIGELITEYGIGNGVSLVIFAGIVSALPTQASQLLQLNFQDDLPKLIGFAAVILAVIAGVILVTEAQRNIPVSYARSVRGSKGVSNINTHLPLRLNQAGVIPIIFAISIMLFPAMIAQFFINARSPWLADFARDVINFFNTQGYWYAGIYFVLIIFFSYFYTAIVFNPDEVAENVQRNGGFISGLRPGRQTADYLYKVLNRILLPGAFFLGLIALLPVLMQNWTGTNTLTFGGTSLLIVVGVVIETIKQINAQLTMHDYDVL